MDWHIITFIGDGIMLEKKNLSFFRLMNCHRCKRETKVLLSLKSGIKLCDLCEIEVFQGE